MVKIGEFSNLSGLPINTLHHNNEIGILKPEQVDNSEIKRMIPCMTLFYNSTWNWEMRKYWDIEVAEPITKIISGNATVKVYELHAVDKMACIVHKGSFSEIGKTYKVINQWIEKNNYKISGPVREIYHKGEWATNNPEEYITEL